jgi:hypothetical protein
VVVYGGHATNLAAITPPQPGQGVVTVDELMNLMRDLIRQLLPEPDITGTIHDKAVRFQCRNQADIKIAATSDDPVADENAIHRNSS